MNERIAHQHISENAQWIADNVIAMKRASAPKRNDLHRYCIDGPYKRQTKNPRLGLLIVVAGALFTCALLGFVYQELKMVDWSSISDLLEVRR